MRKIVKIRIRFAIIIYGIYIRQAGHKHSLCEVPRAYRIYYFPYCVESLLQALPLLTIFAWDNSCNDVQCCKVNTSEENKMKKKRRIKSEKISVDARPTYAHSTSHQLNDFHWMNSSRQFIRNMLSTVSALHYHVLTISSGQFPIPFHFNDCQ